MSACRRYGVTTREVSSEEFFESVGGDGVFNGVGPDCLDAEVMRTCLVDWDGRLYHGGLGALFDFVHVAQCSFNLREEVFVGPVRGEARPSYVVTSLYGFDPCLFDRVSYRCMEISDEVRYSPWDVCAAAALAVC